jgi:hypothetical protein
VDFITETSPQQSAGERVIDTGYDFVPPVPTRLNGRKYVSENTVKELALLIGWVDGDAARRVQSEFDAYKAKVQELLTSLEGIGARVEDIVAAAQPDPNSISVTPPADAEAQADEADRRAAVEAQQHADTAEALAAAKSNEEA